MLSQDTELQGLAAAPAVPGWLRGLLQAVRSQGLQPKDERVKSLWNLLKQRNLLNRSLLVRALLTYLWTRGLRAAPRPGLKTWLVRRLRRWGILSLFVKPVAARPVTVRPLRARPVRPVRPLAARPVRPVVVRPVARAAAR